MEIRIILLVSHAHKERERKREIHKGTQTHARTFTLRDSQCRTCPDLQFLSRWNENFNLKFSNIDKSESDL